MNSNANRFVASIALLLLSTPAGAPVLGTFSGLPDLISASDHIVVAMILSESPSMRASTLNDAQLQRVLVLRVLKGSIAARAEVSVTLRTMLVLGGGDFHAMHQYLLFLQTAGNGTYRLVSVPGSAFRVPFQSKVSELREGDVRANIETLLRDAVRDMKERAASFETQAEEYLRSR